MLVAQNKKKAQGALGQPFTGTPLSEEGDYVSASTSATSFRPHMRKPPADIYDDGHSDSEIDPVAYAMCHTLNLLLAARSSLVSRSLATSR